MFACLVSLFNAYWATYYFLQKWFFPNAYRKTLRETAKEVQEDKHFTLKSISYQRAVNLTARD